MKKEAMQFLNISMKKRDQSNTQSIKGSQQQTDKKSLKVHNA